MGNDTHATTTKTIDVSNSFHNRNLSVNNSTLHDSTANIQNNMRKLEPLTNTIQSEGPKRKSIDPNAVKMVSTMLKNHEDITLKSR